MIERKHVDTPLKTKSYYYDPQNEREYRRVIGGIGWPSGEKPGFVCIVGENEHERKRLKQRDYYVVTEHSDHDVEKLVNRCYDFQNKYLVETWYANADNVLMIYFVDRFNEKLSKKKKGIYVVHAPFGDDNHNLRLYANQIRSRTRPATKTLHFGEASLIPGTLRELSPDDVLKRRAEEHPTIAALGYAISALEEPYSERETERELHEKYISQKQVVGL